MNVSCRIMKHTEPGKSPGTNDAVFIRLTAKPDPVTPINVPAVDAHSLGNSLV